MWKLYIDFKIKNKDAFISLQKRFQKFKEEEKQDILNSDDTKWMKLFLNEAYNYLLPLSDKESYLSMINLFEREEYEIISCELKHDKERKTNKLIVEVYSYVSDGLDSIRKLIKTFNKYNNIGSYMFEVMSDVEATIKALSIEEGGRQNEFVNGYRPAHLVKNDYLTTGVHEYYDTYKIKLGEYGLGTITFITPEAYPHCLWIGKVIKVQEGSRIVGDAKIRKIFNKLLIKND